jgi:hypothetical protein
VSTSNFNTTRLMSIQYAFARRDKFITKCGKHADGERERAPYGRQSVGRV